jgi:hypothetical protein
LIASIGLSQDRPADTAIHRLQIYEGFDLPRNYKFQYKYALKRVRKVYPLALHAARVLDSLDREVEKTDKNRKQKKIARKTHRDLKDDFKFLLKELYVSEGKVLTKLIYRETGRTVKEIIAEYKGDAQAGVYSGMASLFDQNLEATYDANGDDFVLECVIQDIKSGKVDFDSTFVTVDREHFRDDRKAYKKRIREGRKGARQDKREARREKRELKRNKKSEE